MPKLSTNQEVHLYIAFYSYLLAHTSWDAREKRMHMKMCNFAMGQAGLPIVHDLMKSFEASVFNIEMEEANDKS